MSQGSRQPLVLPGLDIQLGGAYRFGKYVIFVIPPVSIISSPTFHTGGSMAPAGGSSAQPMSTEHTETACMWDTAGQNRT